MLCCLPLDLSEQANPQTIKLMRILKIICAVQVCLGIFTMFVSIWSGIMLLLGAMILVLAIWTKNWCTCIIYIILCMMDIMSSVLVVGDYFSENDVMEDNFAILVVLYMIRFPFYLVAIYYTFLAYRELKGLLIESIDRGGAENYGAVQNWYNRDSSNQREPPPPPSPQPFTGTGYRLG